MSGLAHIVPDKPMRIFFVSIPKKFKIASKSVSNILIDSDDHNFLIFQYLIKNVLLNGVTISCMVRLLVQNVTGPAS
jgi:hypothetical protein